MTKTALVRSATIITLALVAGLVLFRQEAPQALRPSSETRNLNEGPAQALPPDDSLAQRTAKHVEEDRDLSAEPSTGHTIVSIWGPSEDPLFGLSVTVTRGGSSVDFAVPANSCDVVIPASDLGGAVLSVDGSPNFGKANLRIPNEPDKHYIVKLGLPSSMRGTALMADGKEMPRGSFVFAWPTGTQSSLGHNQEDVLADPHKLTAPILLGGAFELVGLQAGLNYGITAIGPGVLTRAHSSLTRISTPQDGIQIRAAYLYGVKIILCDAEGSPIQLPLGFKEPSIPGPDDPRFSFTISPDADLTPLSPRTWGLRLQGLGGAATPTGPMRDVFLTSNTTYVGPPPISLDVDIAAFGSANQMVRVHPVEGPLEVEAVRLSRASPPTGQVLVEVKGGGEWPAGSPATPATASLKLDRILQGGQVVPFGTVALAEYGSPPWLVSGIPLGTYESRLHLSATSKTIPDMGLEPARIVVREQETGAPVTFNASGTGILRIDVLDEYDLPYTGPLSLDLMRPSTIRAGEMMALAPSSTVFSGPPYDLPLIPAGTYNLYIGQPLVDTMAVESRSVRVAPSEVTKFTVHLAE